MAKGQRARKSKTSNGSAIGSQKVKLNDVQKVLMGRGMAHVTVSKKNKSAKRH